MKNEAAWLELFESDVFNDRDDHRYDIVWKIVQSLQHRQNLTSRDVFDLQCLIDVLTLPDPRITQQAEEVARLRKALEKIGSGCTACSDDTSNPTVLWMQNEARAALLLEAGDTSHAD